jgi:hypothetical protein
MFVLTRVIAGSSRPAMAQDNGAARQSNDMASLKKSIPLCRTLIR